MSQMTLPPAPPSPPIFYPETDGKPMAENTLQFRWIVTLEGGIDFVYHGRPDVFVAGDLLWYPVQGRPDICQAPDTLVAFGRPKGHRGSYKQWEEANIAPQVVFEVLSPGNRKPEMDRKFNFYDLRRRRVLRLRSRPRQAVGLASPGRPPDGHLLDAGLGQSTAGDPF